MSQQLHRRREWKLTRSLVIPSCRRSRVKAGEVRQDRAASDELAIISPPPPLWSMIGGLLFSTRPRGHAAVQQQWYQQFESRSLRQDVQSGHSFSCACHRSESRRKRPFPAICPNHAPRPKGPFSVSRGPPSPKQPNHGHFGTDVEI
jgi:hypothetical protein